MKRWSSRLAAGLAALWLAGGLSTTTEAARLVVLSHSAVAKSAHYPGHPFPVGRVTAVNPSSITVQYPIQAPVPEVRVGLDGAYLRAGFYPVAKLPFSLGQRVLIVGARSSHPTVMLLPEAHGRLAENASGWALRTHEKAIPLLISNPSLLGGAKLQTGERVEVFGRRQESQIDVELIAAKPKMERAVVTQIEDRRIGLRFESGRQMTFSVRNLSPELSERLTHLKPNTPVLAVVSPAGAILGVLPLKPLWHGPGFQR